MAMKKTDSTGHQRERRILDMCERALKGQLRPEDVWGGASGIETEDAFMAQLMADLVDAVEHTPVRWFSSKLDERAWYSSEEFLTLYTDYRVLQRVSDPQQRLAKRNDILRRDHLTTDAIDAAVADN